ncbi:unnamed protein product [Rotaria magnacalcarata]|uniref:Uncharacterized protein n=1 Tax=Rotaria magnacalcarata TaxID=392030 RepID=A0A819SG59_9BILA|nr:unnamed protein product [Rotaria magnacalcarata]
MLDRFAAVEKNFPIFRKRFREAINRRYNHLSEQELFSGEGIIKKEIFNHLKSNERTYPNCFCSNNEIRIINCENLYIDTDLSDSEYYGVNIVLVSPHQILVENKTELNIITNGKDADDDWKDRPAKSGHGTDRKGNGNKGEDGYDGKPGKSAGHAYIVANKLPRINISAVGGKGGQGQNGANGAKGSDGKDGKDADKEALLEKAQHRDILYSERAVRVRRKGIDGKPGSSGGDAEITSENPNGQRGKPGEAGKHGRDGRAYVVVGEWKRFKRKIKTKGGRLHESERYNSEETGWFEDYSMPSFDAPEDHYKFRERYNDGSTKRGTSATHKHKDNEVAKQIHAINYQNVFLHTAKFFEKYCNPKNEVSYQHRLVSSLNHFLEKMAELEGLPADKIKTQPNIEHDLQQILILKEEFSQTVHIENQRIQAEKLDTNQLSTGIMLLSQQILNQCEQSLKQHQSIYQQLQDEIQRVDVNHLATGLDIRSTEIVNLRNTITRIVNEQRFSQRLAALYNLQQANFNLKDLKTNKDQQSQLYEICIEYSSLRGSILLDSLIGFTKALQTEWLRHYLIIWIMKTVRCIQEFSYESEKNLRNLLQAIRKADHNQLEQIDYVQQSSHILEGFPYYDFDKILYQEKRF